MNASLNGLSFPPSPGPTWANATNTSAPTQLPTYEPTSAPTEVPTLSLAPSGAPTNATAPSPGPTHSPAPTATPTGWPTETSAPTLTPAPTGLWAGPALRAGCAVATFDATPAWLAAADAAAAASARELWIVVDGNVGGGSASGSPVMEGFAYDCEACLLACCAYVQWGPWWMNGTRVGWWGGRCASSKQQSLTHPHPFVSLSLYGTGTWVGQCM